MCRHLHGHQGQIKIFLSSNRLEAGMVTDFKHLNWFKEWLDIAIDHKFIIDLNDPLNFDLASHYTNKSGKIDLAKLNYQNEGYYTPKLELLPPDSPQALIEKYEGFVFVDFIPTSENLTAWIYEIVSKKMVPLGVEVSSVEFWETPKSHCKVLVN
jgi:6-pyruvoyltetrahydropterin/6-carboxytetrahydropterin synthase